MAAPEEDQDPGGFEAAAVTPDGDLLAVWSDGGSFMLGWIDKDAGVEDGGFRFYRSDVPTILQVLPAADDEPGEDRSAEDRFDAVIARGNAEEREKRMAAMMAKREELLQTIEAEKVDGSGIVRIHMLERQLEYLNGHIAAIQEMERWWPA